MTQRRRQRGATFVGYSIGLMALLTGLLAPVFEGGKSAVDMLADSMKQEHSGYRYAVSTLRLSNDMGVGSGSSGGSETESGGNGGAGSGSDDDSGTGNGSGGEDERDGGLGDEAEEAAEDEPLPLSEEIACETTYNSGDDAAEREEDKGFWGSLWDSVKNATTHVYDFVKGFWEGIKQQVGDIIDAVTEPIETAKGLYEFAKQLINEPAATLKAIGEALGTDFSVLTQCGPYDQGVIVGQYANPAFMVKLITKLAKFDDLKVAIRKTKDDFGCASFSAGTPVWLADGRGPIDSLIKGQLVQSRHDATFGDQAQAINYTFGRTADHYYALTTEFENFHVTGEHPFWLQGKGWTEVKDLKRGDPIATATGDVLVLQNQRVDQPLEVYNFSVAHTPSYFVGEGGVWVHNAECELPDSLVPLSPAQIDEILLTPKGQRPDPSEYLSASYIENHLSKFDEGAVRFTSHAGVNKYGSLGPDGGFILPKSEFDRVVLGANGDLRIIEQRLGLEPGYLGDNDTMVVHIEREDMSGLRMPSGNEGGANSQWIPGGYTSGGVSEAVMDFSDKPAFTEIEF